MIFYAKFCPMLCFVHFAAASLTLFHYFNCYCNFNFQEKIKKIPLSQIRYGALTATDFGL